MSTSFFGSPVGKNGLYRDLCKLEQERNLMLDTCVLHYTRRKFDKFPKPSWWHSNTNVWVEERRASAYYTGHRDMLIAYAYRIAIAVLIVIAL